MEKPKAVNFITVSVNVNTNRILEIEYDVEVFDVYRDEIGFAPILREIWGGHFGL